MKLFVLMIAHPTEVLNTLKIKTWTGRKESIMGLLIQLTLFKKLDALMKQVLDIKGECFVISYYNFLKMLMSASKKQICNIKLKVNILRKIL